MHLPEIQKNRGLLRRPLPLNPNTAATRFAHRRLSDEKKLRGARAAVKKIYIPLQKFKGTLCKAHIVFCLL